MSQTQSEKLATRNEIAEQFNFAHGMMQIPRQLIPICKEIMNHSGLLGDYNDGGAWLAEGGKVLCIKGRSYRGITTNVLREADDNPHVRISHMSTEDGQAYMEIRPN